jgi:hypothetical protein
MSAAGWIDVPVLGKLPPEQAAEKLRQLGAVKDAEAVAQAAGAVARSAIAPASWWPFADRPWQHVGHAFGLVGRTPAGGTPRPSGDAGLMQPCEALKGARVTVTLDGLWAAGYPGRGGHKALFDFYAQSQAPGAVEHRHFNYLLFTVTRYAGD